MGSDTIQVIEVIATPSMQSFDPAISNKIVQVKDVVSEQRVELPFLHEWEANLDASLKGDKGNTKAVAMLNRARTTGVYIK